MELSKISVKKLSVKVFYNAKTRCSFCWKYFGHLILTEGNKKKDVRTEQVFCLACLTAVQKESEDITFGSVKIKCYNKTVSTGNLTRHLRDEHQIRDESTDDKPEEFSVVTRVAKASCPSSAKGTKADKWLLAKDLALWYCKSLLPFDSVSDEGMVDFFKKYNIIKNEDAIPSRYIVGGTALTNVYESMLSRVKENISRDAAMNYALAFDLWSDQHRRLNYVTFTIHYLTSDFIYKTFTLSTEIMTEKETSQKIGDAINDIKDKFLLIGKNIVAVTDLGESAKQAVLLANMTHHQCLGHGLHNLVTIDGIKSIPEILSLVQKCKEIVKAVRYHAPELQAEADKIQIQLDFLVSLDNIVESIECDEANPVPEIDFTPEDSKGFVQSILGIRDPLSLSEHYEDMPSMKSTAPTRWHCVLEMLECVNHVYNRDLINEMLRNIEREELRMTQREWILLDELATFLKRFREVVQIITSQKTCTINVALVFRSEIIDLLNAHKDDETLILLYLKRNMLANINKRFPVTKLVVAAALLDSRFMSLKEVDIFLENLNMTRASFLSSCVREMTDIDDDSSTSITEIKPESTGDPATSLLHKLSKKHSIRTYQGMQEDPIEQECWRYIASADPLEPKDGDLLAYWNNKKNTFPYLSALAKALLCVPATSTSSKIVFSTAELTFTSKRSRLSPMAVNKVMFVHDNYNTCMS